jgi:hypothetical protein
LQIKNKICLEKNKVLSLYEMNAIDQLFDDLEWEAKRMAGDTHALNPS